MKRIILFVLLLLTVFSVAFAEEADRARDIAFDVPVSEPAVVWNGGARGNFHTVSCVGASNGVSARLSATVFFDGETTWQSIDAYVKGILSSVIASGTSAQDMADEAAKRIEAEKPQGFSEDDVPAPWADARFSLECVIAEYPYTPALQEGASGKAVALLQQKMQVLGYYTSVCDGEFGAETAQAVAAVQAMMRNTELSQIAQLSAPAQTDAEDISFDGAVPLAENGIQPATEVNGVADARLQAFLYSDRFPVWTRTLSYGASGDDVTRLQNRLHVLGCAGSAADGTFGGDTKRAVMIYQYYNNMEQTGIADESLLDSVFSENAQPPENPLMQNGASGETVKTLQTRLKTLGFMKGSVDGEYGSATETGVKHLQQYLRQREMDALYADAHETVAPAPVEDEDDIALYTQPAHTATEDEVDMSLVKTQVNGIADPMLLDEFYASSFPVLPDLLREGDSGMDVIRVQRRLQDLSYMYSDPDGDFGSGTTGAIKDFQKRHGLSQDGIAGRDTLSILFSEDAKKALKPYELRVSTADQRVYVYAPDANDEYTVLVRTMKCSTGASGTATPKGTYQASTAPGARWHYFKKFDCWAQYAFYIQGDIMFHSVLYNKKDGPVTQSSVNNLGRRASHGCVRLSVEDAKWIWSNCPARTKVVVY